MYIYYDIPEYDNIYKEYLVFDIDYNLNTHFYN